MSNINSVAVSGNCTRDPEVKSLPSGTSVAEFGLAVNRRRKDGDEYVEEVSFFDITVFGSFADLVGRKVKKGDPMTVHGRLQQDRWETDEGNRSKVKIIANEIDGDWQFRSKDEDNVPAAEPAAAATEAPAEAAPAAADDDIPF